MARPSHWISHWFALQTDLSHRRILLSVVSALVAVGLVTLVSQLSLSGTDVPLIVASLGASAVLLFAVPSSTLSTPWAFVGGHLVSGVIGISCAQWISSVPLATAAAIGLAMLAMFYLRCLHPPGGAIALLAVVGGDSIQSLGYQFILTPVMLNVAVMLVCVLLYQRLLSSMRHRSGGDSFGLEHDWQRSDEEWLQNEAPFSHADLSHMDTFLDISQQDLSEIYTRAMQQAHTHSLAGMRCGEIMHQPVIYVEYGTELEEAWQLFEQHSIRGVPVVDSFNRVLGIITVSDFVRRANGDSDNVDEALDMAERLVDLRQRTPGFESSKAEVVGQLMTIPVITAQVDDSVAKLLPLFTQHAIHHLPVIDENRKLVGMLTREHVMAARAGKTS